MAVPRMRLQKDAYAAVKELDPHTAVTPHAIRQLALDGKIKSVAIGRKRLINIDSLMEYLNGNIETPEVSGSGIRKLQE